MERVYVVKGKTKCYIRYKGTIFAPGSNFYAELNEKDSKFFEKFLEDVSINDKKYSSAEVTETSDSSEPISITTKRKSAPK